MKNINNNSEFNQILNSTNPIETWMEISHACDGGTMAFISNNKIDINNKESIKYGLKTQTFYKLRSNTITPQIIAETFLQKWYDRGKNMELLEQNPWHIPGFKQFVGGLNYMTLSCCHLGYRDKNSKIISVCFNIKGEQVKALLDKRAARKAAKFIPNPIDHRIKLLKKIMGSNIPMKFAHSILIKEGMNFAPTLFRMWEKCESYFADMTYFEGKYFLNELECGRDRKKHALSLLGVELPQKDPNYVDLRYIKHLLQQRIAATEKDVAINFYWFVHADQKYQRDMSDPYTYRRPASVLSSYCNAMDDFTLGVDIGLAGSTAKRLYNIATEYVSIIDGDPIIFSTKKVENTMKDLFPSELQ